MTATAAFGSRRAPNMVGVRHFKRFCPSAPAAPRHLHTLVRAPKPLPNPSYLPLYLSSFASRGLNCSHTSRVDTAVVQERVHYVPNRHQRQIQAKFHHDSLGTHAKFHTTTEGESTREDKPARWRPMGAAPQELEHWACKALAHCPQTLATKDNEWAHVDANMLSRKPLTSHSRSPQGGHIDTASIVVHHAVRCPMHLARPFPGKPLGVPAPQNWGCLHLAALVRDPAAGQAYS